MRRAYLAAPFLIACAVILAAGLYGQLGSKSTDTPTHVTAVFFDGVNHGDYRQTCSVWQAARSKMSACESGLARQLGMSALMGEWGGYRVVPHSEKVWAQPIVYGCDKPSTRPIKVKSTPGSTVLSATQTSQNCKMRTVELATVDVVYAPTGGQKLTAHLKRLHGRWLIWYVL